MGRLRLSWRCITVLTVYLITIFTKVTGTEKFELELSSYTNALAFDTEGNCCGSGLAGECSMCETFFRICLLEYMRDIPSDVENTQACTFGEEITPVLGDNSFNIPRGLAEDNNFANPLKVPLNFAWPGTFTLIIQAFHDVTTLGPAEGSERQLLTRVAFQQFLNVSERWTNKTHTEGNHELDFSYRVVCNDNYHGPSCSAYCRPKDDNLGHWRCDANGQKVCLDGWEGDFCDTALCAEGCTHGTCDIPGTCRCQYGWEGELCDQCITIEGCVNGVCSIPGQCDCLPGWGDVLCDQDIYYCTNRMPCKNGATCLNQGPNGFECYCAPGFTGADCSEAAVCPCENGGTCQSTAEHGYVCACPSGFTGNHCEFIIPSCACSNGGTCISNQDGYQCMCPEGFTGNRCETRNYCSSSPCVNGGTCVNTLTGFSCLCLDGYTGSTCDRNVCAADVCKNGGTCVSDFDNLRCLCPRSYTGIQCEIELTECQLTTPCAHGATCVDHETTGYECLCHVGYTGRNCTVPSACLSNACLNGGTCSPDLNNPLEFVCSCASGWTGKTCGLSEVLAVTVSTETTESSVTKATTDARLSPGGVVSGGGGTNSPYHNNPRGLSDVTQIAIYVSFGVLIIILIIILIIVVYRRQHVDHHHAHATRDVEKPDSTPNNRHMYRDNFSQEEKVLPLLSISSKVCNTESDNFSKSKCKDFPTKGTYHESLGLPVEKISTQECMSYVPQTRHSLPRLCDSDDNYYYYDEKASQLKRTESLHSTCQSTDSTPRHNIKCSIVQISAVIEDNNPRSVNRNSQCYSVHLNEERSTPARLQATEV